ncbi:hypothetical protein CEP52_002135 [Fusarium oligoseptatum]|uniref:Ankyrin repeat protein n=1 Tax=Fusarium oligoseptatum TaxID=2604345 RepID=A0A428UFW4_9HYPO|nr:hypothetical protein CEP52_002135 [Fusarium oligoseptatum]
MSATQELESCFQAQSGLLGTKVEEASATTCEAVERVRQEQQTTSIMFTEMMTRVLDSQERTEVQITETRAELLSLNATCHLSPPQTPPSRRPRDVMTEPSRFKSPTRASSSSREPSTDIPDGAFAKVRERTEEWRWKQPLARQNWSFRTKAGAQDPDDPEGRLEGSVSLTLKKNVWKARALFKARVNILGRRIICLEIKAQQFTQTWFGMPFLSGQISIVNVRPSDAPIFKACVDFNLPMVKHLLETGEASIHDVNGYGEGLLERALSFSKPRTELLRFLLEQGCNPNVFHGDGLEPVRKEKSWEPEEGSLHLCQEAYERSEQLRVPDFLISWSANGILCREPYHSDDGSEYDPSVSTESWSGEEDGFTYEESDLDEEQPFKNTTLFYETISTEEGRRQLARFPLVRLLVNALQLAGYRAVMDFEGDVWFDDDDGDIYFDAREYQPEEGVDDGLVANCPICQDPEKYGLGHIFAEAERAREFLREYRRKKSEEKRWQRW